MKLYAILIVLGNILIDVFNIFIFQTSTAFYITILITFLCTLVCFVIDLILACVIRALPEKWFNYKRKIFTIFNCEKNFYEFVGVKNFKDKVPEVGKGFRKNKVSDPKNPEYIRQFVLECCYGEVIHVFNIILGFLAIFCFPQKFALTICLPVCLVNGFLSLLPIFVLRYNRKKLENVLLHLEKKH